MISPLASVLGVLIRFRRIRAHVVGTHACVVGALMLSGPGNAVQAQTAAEIRLTASAIAAGAEACTVWEVRRAVGKRDATTVPDSLTIRVFADTTWKKPDSSHVALTVSLEGTEKRSVDAKTPTQIFALESQALAGRALTIAREKSADDAHLCAVVLAPTPSSGARIGFRSTQFIADGAVSAGLRSGGGAQSLTGSLGIDHRDIKSPTDVPRYLLSVPFASKPVFKQINTFMKLFGPLAQERLKAVIAIANMQDTLSSKSATAYRDALLAPWYEPKGRFSAASVDYYRALRFNDGSHGPRLNVTIASGPWEVDNADSILVGVPVSVKRKVNATLISFDARWRFTFIEHMQDPKGNDFSFALEAGWSWRSLAGDVKQDELITNSMFGGKTKFNGKAFAAIITLRQVTAIADIPSFRRKKGAPVVPGLIGMQPIVKINFAAPMFTF